VSQRPRLLILVTLAEVGGAQTYVTLLLPALAGRLDVTVAAHGPGPVEAAARSAGFRFVPLRHVRRAVHPWHDLLGLVELFRLCRRMRPDIVHANSSKAGVLGRVAAFLARVPIRIFTVHGWAFTAHQGLAGRLYLWADRLMRPLTSLAICVSENERAIGLSARTCSAQRTVVVHNAVETTPVAERQETPVPRVVSVGRFKYPKDFGTLIEAFAKLDRPFVGQLVGDGPDRSTLEAATRRHNLSGRVEFLGERNDVPALLAGAEVFVLSSRSEGLPVSVLEAMSAQLPVIASAVGGVPELVVEGETGLLVPPGDIDALAHALERLLADGQLRRRLGEAGRHRLEERFGVDEFRRRHLELYRRELERRGLSAPSPEAERASAKI
jgi:glycosyltransferase involved in cell wall biosynthesis